MDRQTEGTWNVSQWTGRHRRNVESITNDRQTQRERGMYHNALDRQIQRECGKYLNEQADTEGTWNVSRWTGRHRGNVECITMDTQAQREHAVSQCTSDTRPAPTRRRSQKPTDSNTNNPPLPQLVSYSKGGTLFTGLPSTFYSNTFFLISLK